MKFARAIAIATLGTAAVVTVGMTAGCAVGRGQETVGAYVDDATITTAIKAKYVEDKSVAATSIKVETLNGVVQLSGFARTETEKQQAGTLARNVRGVREVRNNILVRP